MNVRSTIEQKVHLTLSPTTDAGNPATVDGTPIWTIESGNATIEADENGLGAWLISADEPGESTYKVTADADLGEGVRPLEGTGTYTYGPAEANTIGLVADTPVLK